MSTIVTRAGKGSPLTNNEVDSNFTNLNTDKVESITSADGSVVVSTSGTTRDLSVGIAGSTATLISQVRNQTGATLTKGTLVYISGASGNKALVSKALATGDATSAQTYGMVQADIPHNQNGYVVVIGVVSGLDTSTFTEGVQLYLSPTTAGTYTSTKPYAPNHLVYIGVVTGVHANQGTIEVKIQNGYEMDELHNVSAQSPTNGDTLVYNSTTTLWTKTAQSTLSVASAAAVPFSGVTSKPTTLSGYGITDAYSSSNPSGFISGITSGQVTTALGFTPYNATNPAGYTTNTGTVTGVTGTAPVVSSGGTAPAISMAAASAGVNGYMTGVYATKLDGIATGATNVTNNNQLTNGSGYITSSALTPYLTTATAASTYLPLAGGTVAGPVTITGNDNQLIIDATSGATAGIFLRHGGVNRWEIYNSSTSSFGLYNYTTGQPEFTIANATGVANFRNTPTAGGNAILHAGNYNSYSPTLTGTGASGTWGISITGTANVANSATSAGYLTGGDSGFYGLLYNTLAGDLNTYNSPGLYSAEYTGSTNKPSVGANGHIIQISDAGGTDVKTQWFFPNGGSPYMRLMWGNTNWNPWLALLTSSNYNSYSPTLTGTGASGTWAINITGSAGSAGSATTSTETYRGIIQDTRAGLRSPNAYDDYRAHFEFTDQIVGGDWHTAFTMQGWHDAYSAWQIIGPASTTAHENFYLRSGVNTSWNSVRTILHSGNYNSYAPTLTGTGASGTWGISITGNAATVTNGLYKVGTNAIPAAVVLNTTADNWMWQWASSGSNDWYLGPTTANFGIGGSRLAISSSGSSPNAELSIERGTTRLLEILQANLQYKSNVVLHAGNYSSYALPLSGGTLSGDLRVNTIRDTAGGWVLGKYGTEVSLGSAGLVNEIRFNSSSNAAFEYRGNAILHAANYSSYALPLSGGSLTGALSAVSGLRSYYSDHIAGDGYGIRFWESNAYKISMGASSLYQYGTVTDYSIKMQMDNGSPGRGFTWGRESYAPIASLNATSGNFQTAGQMYVQGAQIASGALTVRAGGAAGVGWGTGLNIGDSSNYSGFIQDAGISRWRNTGSGGYDWFNSATTQIMALSNSGYLGVGQASDASYRIIASGHMYANAGGNVYAEGRHYSRHGTGTFYESLTTGNYTNYAVAVSNTQEFSSEVSASVGSDGWYTIATHGGSRGYAEFWVYDNDSSRHNFVQLGVVFSFGQGGITVLASGRHGTSTIRHARLLYNTSNQTYGGAKLQIYCENAAWTIICRMGNDNKFSGWSEWSIITPVLENTPSGWAEYNRVEAINDQGVIGGYRLRIGSTDALVGGYSVINGQYNSSLNSDSRNSRGVTRLYRRDDNSDYSVQTYWTGSYWRLYGYNGDSNHADTQVGLADNSSSLQGYGWFSSGKDIRGSDIYADNWLRNYNSGTGLYNQATGNHWYSDGQYWNVGYAGTTGVRLRNGHAGTVLGYLYAETNQNMGLLNSSGNWAVQVYPGGTGGGNLAGTWTGGNIKANRANGNLYIDDNYGNGVVGVYSSYRYQGVFAMGDSYKMSADGTSLSNMYGMAWSHPNAGGAAGNLTDHGLLIINAGAFKCAISNSIVASANITAYSDERLKTNWRDMPEDYVARLAKVKVGIYDRTDQEDVTQVGVSAQSFQNLLPQAIMTAKDEMQTLSVNYGGAALASAVELAKRVVDQEKRIAHLESLINKLIGD